MDIWRAFPGPNAAYVLDLWEKYRQDPASVPADARAYFERAAIGPEAPGAPGDGRVAAARGPDPERVVAAANLAQAIRSHGHLAAALDPLGTPPPGDPALALESYGLTEEDLKRLPAALLGGPAGSGGDAWSAIQALRGIYSGTTGFDYSHIKDPAEREWLRDAAESRRYRPPASPVDPLPLLERLTRVEAFEGFLHRTFPGTTRFSIEGLDMMLPMTDEIIEMAAHAGICELIIGMAHRGRLNFLAHILNKPYEEIFAEFRDPVAGLNFTHRDDLGWTGDVKYHKGASRAFSEDEPVEMLIRMPPNPSHLEHVNPVVTGMARASSLAVGQPGAPRFSPDACLPVIVHGDASFPGEGIVTETLNLSRVPGWRVGGAIHIIANNQLGFTTPPAAGRSTLYASDPAKGYGIPIIHVNADDPEACLEAVRIALAYRQQFHQDFLIDLIGYRRYGHNEGDEPSFTQPLMYRKVGQHPSVRRQWAERLVAAGLLDAVRPDQLVREQMERMQEVLAKLAPEEEVVEPQLGPPPRGMASSAKTAVSAETLRELNEALLRLPESFTINPKLERPRTRRRAAVEQMDEPTIEWGTAEELALATILAEGIAVRLTGQDTERGTFNQRHGVLHDAATGSAHIPLQALPQAKAAFELRNSPLSENAALAFEYGYNIQSPERLVIWEAQYGDFINAAQAVVDEFIVSGRAKWEQTPSLVLLLPHGYEGQGPDHSSGRLERFLDAAAEINLRIAYPTTAAQYFHLLRRQAQLLCTDPLPLVVMSPKSLLRHKRSASTLRELAEGAWRPVIDDVEAAERRDEIDAVLLCSGKVYVDLVDSKHREQSHNEAIVRLEQLFAFPETALRGVLEGYPKLQNLIWVQEEPENMGAWGYVQPRLAALAAGRWTVHYVGRPPSSSPAEGSTAMHRLNQEALVEQAFDLEATVARHEIAWLKKE